MKKTYKYISLFALLIISLPVIAQDGFDDFGGDVPIDGGLTLLVTAGIGYGINKLSKKNE